MQTTASLAIAVHSPGREVIQSKTEAGKKCKERLSIMDPDQENAWNLEQESEFVRGPILENQVFFLRSTCSYCGFTILASSIEDLLEQEEKHQRRGPRTGHLGSGKVKNTH